MQHQHAFEQLFDGARQFADAAGYANHLNWDTLVLVSICHAQQLRIDELETRVDDFEAQLSEDEEHGEQHISHWWAAGNRGGGTAPPTSQSQRRTNASDEYSLYPGDDRA